MYTDSQDPFFRYPTQDPPQGHRIFCFPHGGSGSSHYFAWSRFYPGKLAILPVFLPGRDHRLRERPYEAFSDLLDDLVPSMRTVVDERPYSLYGHSMGCAIAFEVARALSEDGHSPSRLIVSGSVAPNLREPIAGLSVLPDDEFIKEITRRYQGIPPEVLQHAELMEILIPLLRADVKLMESYQFAPGAALSCPIHCFGGLDDSSVPKESLEPWKLHTEGTFQLEMLPGNHFFHLQHAKSILDTAFCQAFDWIR
ncbi:MAG: thioesterase [Planctomycetales bacterium]|nr:thioesterase [Planctomycetales bacterium]